MTKQLLIRIGAVLATAVTAAIVALLVTGPTASGLAGAPQAWIDDPLHGETLPLAPVTVVAHAYDGDGVAEMTLLVDGVVDQTSVPEDSGDRLTDVEWSWRPPRPGVYVLQVVGSDASGGEGVAARAVVEIVDTDAPVETTTTLASTTTTTGPPTTTTTTPPTTTTTAAPTTTTAAPPCTPPAPVLLSPSDGTTIIGSQPSIDLDWSAWRGLPPQCQPSGFVAQVATDATFAALRAEASFAPSATTWTPLPTTWSCNQTHHWRVWSTRSDGSLAAVSATWEIDIVCIG